MMLDAAIFAGRRRAHVNAGFVPRSMTAEELAEDRRLRAAAAAQPKPAPLMPQAARAKLAEAHQQFATARREFETLRAAEPASFERLHAAEAAHAEAEAALAEAQNAASATAVAVLTGRAAEDSGPSLRVLRERVEDAADTLAAAHGARRSIREQIDQARERIARLEQNVRAAAIAVVAAEVAPDTIGRAQQAQQALAEALVPLRWLHQLNALTDEQTGALKALYQTPMSWDSGRGAPRYEDALLALLRDAAAALPDA